MRILVLNTGSSSLKHALVETSEERLLAEGEERWRPDAPPGRHRQALEAVLAEGAEGLNAVAHRVVHGGTRFAGPALVDAGVLAGIEALVPLAPLHNRSALEAMHEVSRALPTVPQVACFDTAFHSTLPPAAATYALPRGWREELGVRRFGFHGLSVAWSSRRAVEMLGAAASRRLVVCHLGSGSSITAVLDGRSVDTTMGLTPLEGVPMATRSGTVDPGALIHLLRRGVSLDELEHGLVYESGLLGLSGVSSDLRDVLAAAQDGHEDAALAVAVLVRGIAAAVAAMTTALDGLDCLVFTAGAGEHSPALRSAIVDRLRHLGLALDESRNAASVADEEIGAGHGPAVLVVRAREEMIVAGEAETILRRAGVAPFMA